MQHNPSQKPPALLIRRFDREEHAREVNKGVLGCRSLLSCLFTKTNGSYRFVDYFEETFAHELFDKQTYFIPQATCLPKPKQFLLRALCDPTLLGAHMTFTHAVDPEITPSWLNGQKGGYYAFLTPHYEYGEYFIGHNEEYVISGQKMNYVDKPEDIDPRTTNISNPWTAPALDDLLTGGVPTSEAGQLARRYTLLFAALFNRVLGEGTSYIENEFRILRWDRRHSLRGISQSESRTLFHKLVVDGKTYLVKPSFLFQPTLPLCGPWNQLVTYPEQDPSCTVNLIELLSSSDDAHPYLAFEYIDLNLIAENWGYIGNLDECRAFVASWLKGKRQRKETANFHKHHGPWPQTLIRKIRSSDEVAQVVPSEDPGYYKTISNAENFIMTR